MRLTVSQDLPVALDIKRCMVPQHNRKPRGCHETDLELELRLSQHLVALYQAG
jgi:hypothetical protein